MLLGGSSSLTRTYHPFKRKLTPRGRLVWYRYDTKYPDLAFLGAELFGKLVWSGTTNRKDIKLLKSLEDWDEMIDGYPAGNTLAKGLDKKNKR